MDNSAKQTTHSVDSASSPQASSGQTDNNSQLTVDTSQIKNDQATQPDAQAIKPISTPVPNRGGIPVNPAPFQPVLSNTQADTQQASPVVSPRGKEQEPVPAPLPDVAKMSEAEIVNEEKEVEKELESIIEKSPDNEKPDIPKDVQQAGVTHAAEDTP
ncbi:MAG TPA: hypothetical protein VNA13_01180, partial [Xanthomonadales bacterium]|nr:hypothetical protein [Xanthomonadales bacterium]